MGSHFYQVWSLVRRFDRPQKYKPFTNRCVVHGKLEKGSLREVGVKSGLPATTSTERLELLDNKEHILNIRIIGGDHRLKIGVGLMVFQQLGGISGLTSYASSIFVSAGFSSSIGTTIYACIQVAVVIFGANFIDRVGRKPLLLVSASGMILGSLLTALSFYFKENTAQSVTHHQSRKIQI